MFGVHVETIDYNLPVDAITRKPLFAFSANRSIRENYKGPLLRTTNGVDITSENIASHVGQQIGRIYDQKAKHGYVDKTCDSNTGPTLGVDEDGKFYLQFTEATSFLVDIHGDFSDAGFMTVCSSEGFGQHFRRALGRPLFSASFREVSHRTNAIALFHEPGCGTGA